MSPLNWELEHVTPLFKIFQQVLTSLRIKAEILTVDQKPQLSNLAAIPPITASSVAAPQPAALAHSAQAQRPLRGSLEHQHSKYLQLRVFTLTLSSAYHPFPTIICASYSYLCRGFAQMSSQ